MKIIKKIKNKENNENNNNITQPKKKRIEEENIIDNSDYIICDERDDIINGKSISKVK